MRSSGGLGRRLVGLVPWFRHNRALLLLARFSYEGGLLRCRGYEFWSWSHERSGRGV